MLTLFFIIVVILAILVQPLISYFVDRKSLRRFPAPSLAGFTSLWRIWHNLQNKHYLAIHHAHKQLGSHVRIAPNHISVLSEDAVVDIYGHGAGMLKDAWYDGGAGDFRHMADVRVKAEHQAKRKLLAHVFAQKTIANLEPVVADTVSTLMAQVDRHIGAGKTINMRRFMNYFTIDLFGKLLYSRHLGCLERGDDIVTAETPGGETYTAPFIQSLLDATVINTALGMEAGLLPVTRFLLAWHPYKKAGADFENIIRHNTQCRLRDHTAQDDIFSKLLRDNKGHHLDLPFGEILAECSVMMNAGTETTTAAFTNALFLLYKHPSVLAKLRKELDGACGDAEVPSYEDVYKLPYLRACVEESLRVRPASSFGLPRVIPDGGRMVGGIWIDGGVTVSVPTYSMLKDEEAFEQADSFIPDRWITEDKDKKEKMTANHLPFSSGPRACIGRNIAYFEQLLVLAGLVRAFDFEIPEGFEMQTIERFNSNPGELIVKARRRGKL